jgi:hypothetical protein
MNVSYDVADDFEMNGLEMMMVARLKSMHIDMARVIWMI